MWLTLPNPLDFSLSQPRIQLVASSCTSAHSLRSITRCSLFKTPSFSKKTSLKQMIPISAMQFLPQTAADIPQHLYTPMQDASTGGNKNADDLCGCCHKSLFEKDTVKQTSCGHLFHARCIDKYLQKGLYCPVCHVQVLFPAVVAGSVYPSAQLPPRAVPVATAFAPAAGTHPRDYGTCRECGQTFYRDLTKVRPETNGWYRCQRCAPTDIIDFIRGSFCVLQ